MKLEVLVYISVHIESPQNILSTIMKIFCNYKLYIFKERKLGIKKSKIINKSKESLFTFY